jgi:hypothetical protein
MGKTRLFRRAQRDHQDPRAVGDHGKVGRSQRKGFTANFGAFRNRHVARMEHVVNWYRRAAH